MPTSEQEAAFSRYDFGADKRWEEYRLNLTIPPDRADEEAIIRRYKQKYYKRHIDPDYEVDPLNGRATNSGHATSTSRPAGSEPAASETSRRPARGPPAAAAGRAGAAPRASVQQRLDSKNILFMANVWVLVMSALTAFPLMPAGVVARGFRWALIGALVEAGYSIITTHGRPRGWSLDALKTWLQPVLSSAEFLTVLHCIVFLPSNRPIAIAVVPFAFNSVQVVVKHLQENFSRTDLYRKYLEHGCAWIQQNSTKLQMMGATSELTLGFLLVFFIFTPQRNLLQVLLYWQLLKLKYHFPTTSWKHRQAWGQISQRTEPLIHRYAPFLLTPLGYAKRWFTTVR